MLDKSDFLKQIDRVASAGPFTPSWDSLSGCQTPLWCVDAKFGIFIHVLKIEKA